MIIFLGFVLILILVLIRFLILPGSGHGNHAAGDKYKQAFHGWRFEGYKSKIYRVFQNPKLFHVCARAGATVTVGVCGFKFSTMAVRPTCSVM